MTDTYLPAPAARVPAHAAHAGAAVLVGTGPVLLVLLVRDDPQMIRADTAPRVAKVIKGHPRRDRADVQLVCRPVRLDQPPVPPDLAVAAGRSSNPNPAPVRGGRVEHDLREQALLKRRHSAASAARAARIASRPFASAA